MICLLFYRLEFTNANLIMVYLLGVLLISIVTTHQVYGLISSLASVFLFNYLFTTPRFTFLAHETGYPVTFVVMFLTAYISSTLTRRYQEQVRHSARIAREKEAAAMLAEREQLRANLLRTISHDLRTPLTTISGNASSLLSNSASFDEETKRQLYSDIYSDSLWLIGLVENLLYATRIEEGRMTLRTSTELLSELMEEAVRHMAPKAQGRSLCVALEEELLLVRADGPLVVQVLLNLVDNALKYTPAGTPVTITAKKQGAMAEVSVADLGQGIPGSEKDKLFEKFYCGSAPVADNRRSLGLGLYLCKAIVEAHGGVITAADNVPHGAVFRFTLPLEEVDIHE